MQGGIKNAKNIVKLVLFLLIGLGGLVVFGIVARWLVFNGRVAPIFNLVEPTFVDVLITGLP